ncbi:MAG: hypothetical protein SGPRY_000718, partial [Prymnesium sp.]
KESNRRREEASGLISPIGGAAIAVTPQTEKLTSNEKDRVHSDALRHRRRIGIADAQARSPATLLTLAMSTRIDERNGDTKRHRSDKSFTHKRGKSVQKRTTGDMKVSDCDAGSGVKLGERAGEEQNTVLIAQFPLLRALATQVRRCGQNAGLDGYGARRYIDAILDDANEGMNRESLTATA